MTPLQGRLVVVVGSVVGIYIVHLIAGLLAPGFVMPIVDAAVGYGAGVGARHFWPSAPKGS